MTSVARVLVTGASGFIGKAVVDALPTNRYQVVSLGRRRDPTQPNVEFIACDLLDPASQRSGVAAARADYLVHLAWVTEPGVCWTSLSNLDWSAATVNILRLFLDRGGQRAVFAGSCAEYSWTRAVLEESAPCRPQTLYGTAKDATRRLVLAFSESQSLPVAWARLFFMYGPNERPGRLVSDAIASLLERRPFPATRGLQRRDFLHVADVAGALVASLESQTRGCVNIGSGEAVTVHSVLKAIAEHLGGEDLLRFGTLSERDGDPPIIQADVRRLTEEVGFRPRFGLRSGLADTIEAARMQRRANASACSND